MLNKLTTLASQALERGHCASISVQPSGYWTITINEFFETKILSTLTVCSQDEDAEWRINAFIEKGYWK